MIVDDKVKVFTPEEVERFAKERGLQVADKDTLEQAYDQGLQG